MKFSILIAFYNNYPYFLDCYNSIVNQTFRNFEVIIVDDASTDSSFEKLTTLLQGDSRFKVVQNSQNKGVGFTKRRCVELANGEICGFVDPDDTLAENAIELSLKKYKTQNIVATHSDLNMCNENLEFIRLFKNTQRVPSRQKKFLNINLAVNHFFTFKSSAYQKTEGIDPTLTSAVDQDLYLKIYETGAIAYIHEPLYNYRIHEKGVSQEKSKKGKLNENWDLVLRSTLIRRKIESLYGKRISEISDLPKFIFQKENTLFKKLIKKLK